MSFLFIYCYIYVVLTMLYLCVVEIGKNEHLRTIIVFEEESEYSIVPLLHIAVHPGKILLFP